MDEIRIRKVKQRDARSIWENIFSRSTPEEVEQRIAESIADMVVNPAFQKQGLGRKLFEAACKEASKLGFYYVTTTCRGDGTEEFYKSLGMQECGKIPQGIYEPWGEFKRYNEIIFMKEL